MEWSILAGLMLGSVVYAPMAIAQSGTPDTIEDQPAEKVFHNIQVLKGMRAGDLQGAMSFIASSLGVDCDYCHRGEDFGKDIRKEKSRAREMIEMVRQINQRTFHGENKVNCFTCHEGSKDPISLAPIVPPPPRAPKSERAAAVALPGAPLPSVDEVLNHYVQALGGPAAVDGVKSRIIRTAPLDGSNPQSKTTVYQKAPDKVLFARESSGYSLWVGFNGTRAWAQDSEKSYWGILNTPQRNSIMRDSELYQGSRIKSRYLDVRLKGKEKIGEHDSYVVVGTSPESTSEEFFFDAQTGLLLRRHIVEQTIFGGFQIQADFEDYREIDGVRMPFIVRWSSPGGAWGTKVSTKILNIQQNVPIEDEQFNGPPSIPH
ncbi:MAG TPA: c-type cytochrome [Terracidiphilus sp.]|nr:c-type cytochrome [Terracidiphilus sp.]